MPHALASAVGEYGERLAVRYLRERGLVILDRNWRCSLGEIDIVARDGTCLVVCEVKTRRGLAYGAPVEAVTWRKLARLRRLAAAWMQAHEGLDQAAARCDGVRVDVVGVLRPRFGPSVIEHLEGVA
jgi:putative endonuclease